MIVKLDLTKDLLALIANIRFSELPQENNEKKYLNWGVDFNSLYGGCFLLEDVSQIIGKYGEHIEGTEDDVMGPRFSKELEDYMFNLHDYIITNIQYIEDLVHQFSIKGGLTEGTYKCKNYERIWTKVK